MQNFDPIARGNIDTASGCQMMSYSHVNLNRNEHLNLKLENKTPHKLLLHTRLAIITFIGNCSTY